MLKNAACFVALAFTGAGLSSADTMFLKSGKTLKIEALACDALACVATLKGGEAAVRPADVLRVEPDEEVDIEPVPRAAEALDPEVPRTVEEMVRAAAHKYALPRSLLRAVAQAESSLNPVAVSPKGAQGVMQLMPGTARELGVRDAFDASENIDAGARLLRQLILKYDGRLAEALAAYNAGVGAVTKHQGVPPYKETRGYVRKVVKDYEKAEAHKPQAPDRKQP